MEEIEKLSVPPLKDKIDAYSQWCDVNQYKTLKFLLYTSTCMKLEFQFSYKPAWDKDFEGPRYVYHCNERSCTPGSLGVMGPFVRVRYLTEEPLNNEYNDSLIPKFYGIKYTNNRSLPPPDYKPPPSPREPKEEGKLGFFKKKDVPVYDVRLPSYLPDGCMFYSHSNRLVCVPRGLDGQTLCWIDGKPQWTDK